MPVLADPGFAYAQQNPMDTYRQAADTTLSIMERKQAARQREQALAMQQQAQDLQREKWNVEKPVLQAKLNADFLSYGFDLTDRKATEEFRAKAATAATELGTKFREVIQLADWEERSTQLKNLQQEYGWLGRFEQFAPVVKAVDDSRAEAVSNILAEKKLEDTLETKRQEAELRNQYLLDSQRQREEARADEAAARRADAAELAKSNSPESKALANAAVKANQAADDAAELARSGLAQRQRIRELYAAGAKSGPARGAWTSVVTRSLSLLGKDDATDQLTLQQGLENALGTLNLQRRREVYKGTGAVSDSENAYLASSGPSMSNTPEANEAYFTFMDAVDQRTMTLDALVQQWRAEGAGPVEIDRRRKDFVNKNPIPIPSVSKGAPAGMVRIIAPDGTPGFVPADRVEDALKAGGRRG